MCDLARRNASPASVCRGLDPVRHFAAGRNEVVERLLVRNERPQIDVPEQREPARLLGGFQERGHGDRPGRQIARPAGVGADADRPANGLLLRFRAKCSEDFRWNV